eukprot:938785_1
MEDSTSTRTFINNLWFDIVPYLLPSVPVNVSYTECSSMLSNISASNSFLAVPCDEHATTSKPTESPTTSNPSLTPTEPSMIPTSIPIQPTVSTAPTPLPTGKPTQSPLLLCEDNPGGTLCESDTKYCYNACVYPSIHGSSQTTVYVTNPSYGSKWFPVTFSPLVHDCVGPQITFQYQETTYSDYRNYIRIYDSNKNTIKQCGTLSNCGWTDCFAEYSLYDNLGVSEIKAGSTYTFPIYHYFYAYDHTCSGLGVNANLTLSCLQVPSIPTDELVVDEPFRCSYLAENIAVVYDLNYIECVYWQCFEEYGSSCKMVNYLANTNPTRCYLFDKQCVMQSSEDSGDAVTFAIEGDNHFCLDYPYQWADLWSDTCDQYENLLNLCTDGRKTDVETVEYFKSQMYDGFTALDVCCACGGGQHVVGGVIITFDPLSKFNDGDVLCTTNYDTIRTMHNEKHWDNVMLYRLCKLLYDTVWWMLSYTLDCTMFLDSNIDDSLTFSIFICDFDGYVESDYDPYFLFGISMENSTSTSTFINDLWFDIITYLLPSEPVTVSYTECFSMLSNINASNSFLAVPCDEYIASPTSSPTLRPTPIPTTTLKPTNPTVDPTSATQPPTTGMPTAPTAPTAPTLPTDDPTKHPTLRPTKMPTAPTLPTAPTQPTINPTSTQTMETTMDETVVMDQKSAVGVAKTTLTVIFVGFLSTLFLIFLFSYLWKHKIKEQPVNVEMVLQTSQHQGVRE